MRIEVTATDISITETDKLVSGSKLVYTATFVFTGWDGLTKTAVFKPGRANKVEGIPTIECAITGESVVVPWEVLQNYGGRLWVGVYGSDSKGIVKPTTWVDAGPILQGVEQDAENGTTPTPSEYQQFVDSVATNATAAATSATAAAASAEEAKQSAASKADDKVVFTAAATNTDLASGDTNETLWGKAAKWFTSLKSHLADDMNGDMTALQTTDKSTLVAAINEVLGITGTNATAITAVEETAEPLTYQNAGLHNSLYRGKSLGTALTAAQSAAIKAGTFDDMFIGDYWTIGRVVYRIAAFDYYYNVGDTNCTTHHVTVVPDTCLYNAQMNTSNVTTGAYVGSAMYTSNLATAKSTINSAFGSAHVLNHRVLLANAISGDTPSGWAWCGSTVELMSESQVYGMRAWGGAAQNGYSVASQDGQLPLFALRHDLIHNRDNYWLQDVQSAAAFALVDGYGRAGSASASASLGVRPAFSIS